MNRKIIQWLTIDLQYKLIFPLKNFTTVINDKITDSALTLNTILYLWRLLILKIFSPRSNIKKTYYVSKFGF